MSYCDTLSSDDLPYIFSAFHLKLIKLDITILSSSLFEIFYKIPENNPTINAITENKDEKSPNDSNNANTFYVPLANDKHLNLYFSLDELTFRKRAFSNIPEKYIKLLKNFLLLSNKDTSPGSGKFFEKIFLVDFI